jgi:L-amino acid N-acyltransferase YncA
VSDGQSTALHCLEQQEQAKLMHTRHATRDDAAAIARIYNQGIEDRGSTFETRFRPPDEVAQWLDTRYPVIVVESNRSVVAYAATTEYSSRVCYRGVADFAVYVDRDRRANGAGKLALAALYDAAREAGFWKLVSRIFPENAAVRKLNASMGIREVGVHHKHAQLDGAWRDVIVVEWLIVENAP